MTGPIAQFARASWRIITRRAGFRSEEMPGSNSRRFLSRLTGVACLFLVAEALLPIWNFNLDQVRESSIRIAVAWSFAYFVVVVLIPIVLLTGRDFRLQPTRLFNNILLSGAYCVLAFGLLYRKLGFASSIEGMEVRSVADAYYFSAVTFSTLGFGDFRPMPGARGYAAIQGIWGNVHLGVLAGAIFYAISANERARLEKADKHGHDQRDGRDD